MGYLRDKSYAISQSFTYFLIPVRDALAAFFDNDQTLVGLFQLQNGLSPLERHAQPVFALSNGDGQYPQSSVPPRLDVRWGGFYPMIDARKPRSHNHYDGYKTDVAKAIYQARIKHRGLVEIKKTRGTGSNARTTSRNVNFKRHSSLIR